MEIAKQLYDVGRLFENVSDLQITKEAFRKIAVVELSYRSFGTDIGQVFNDIRQTALCISTRGKAGEGDFDLIQDGIIRVKSFMYKQRYLIDHAIIDAARAAYLATLIEKGIYEIESYSNNPADIKDMVIRPSLPNKLNKLRSNLPEAYYYWAKRVSYWKHEVLRTSNGKDKSRIQLERGKRLRACPLASSSIGAIRHRCPAHHNQS